MADQDHRPAQNAAEEAAALAFYKKGRAHVKHEDDLVNQRLTWLLMLQGLLFTAYGFSMSAESTSLAATALGVDPATATPAQMRAQTAYNQFFIQLSSLRQGMIVLGIFSSIAALVGVMAAFRAVKDMNDKLKEFANYPPEDSPTKDKILYPEFIGGFWCNTFGMICGLLVPFLTSAIWCFIGYTVEHRTTLFAVFLWIGAGLTAGLVILVVVFVLAKFVLKIKIQISGR